MDEVSVPFLKILPIYSLLFSSFLTEIRKSIVLNSAGFHLNECSHVVLFGLVVEPIKLEPTPNNEGVRISPSVSYSYILLSILSKTFLHDLKISSLKLSG